jgi:cytochrome c oxidase assembly protein subunit 15
MGANGTARLRGADTLALGFGTSVAMWFVGYLCRMPPAVVPSWLLALLLLGCLAGGGFVAGRLGTRGWRSGLAAGLLSSVVNLLILGSLLGGARADHIVPSALWWLPGSLLLGAALASAGAAVGVATRAGGARPVNWTGALAGVAASATLLQLLVGGLVTSEGAGLSVVDWPNSFGYNMFLYPLSRMTGGVYYEHAHRLFGSLVGLTTVVFAAHLLVAERRTWVKRLGLAAVAAVIVQGILGGLRVTGGFTLSTSPSAMEPSSTLAVVHGALGPAFFGLMVALAAVTSTAWSAGAGPLANPHARSLHAFGTLLVGAVLVQIVLGAIQRQFARGLDAHVGFAVVVLALALVFGARLSRLGGERSLLGTLGRVITAAVTVQVMLGLAALLAVETRVVGAPRAAWDVLLTTLHQAGGSVLLGCAVLGAVWSRRLLVQGESPTPPAG